MRFIQKMKASLKIENFLVEINEREYYIHQNLFHKRINAEFAIFLYNSLLSEAEDGFAKFKKAYNFEDLGLEKIQQQYDAIINVIKKRKQEISVNVQQSLK